MSHFYKYNAGNPKFLEEIRTPAQAKKSKGVMPSVTTVLSVIKDPFLNDIYQPREITRLAREHPNLGWGSIKDLTYGLRKHPTSAKMIPSSEFGTAVHKRIEDHVLADVNSKRADPELNTWDDWAMPFVQWYRKEGVEPIAAEYMIGNPRIKIVGSVDFIGRDRGGEVFLADYKCRANCKGKAKVYDKDLYQLAIEAWMLKEATNPVLDYIPGCISVCIDSDTCQHFHKVWSPEEILHGIEVAKLCSKIYWKTRMLNKNDIHKKK